MEEDPLDSYSPFDSTTKSSNFDNFKTNYESPTFSAEDDIDDETIRELEQRINQMESKINAQEIRIQNATVAQLPPNWPAFYPVIHFDLEEVSSLLRPYAKDAMICWVIFAIAMFLNWFGCLFLLGVNESEISSPGSKITLSTLYLLILTPLLMEFNFLSVYRALKDEASSLTYIKIFLSLGFTFCFELVLSLGFDSSGSVGLITMINLFIIKHWFIGILALLATYQVLFTLN